jgi:hypothetical protein
MGTVNSKPSRPTHIVPIALIALSLIPILAGGLRLGDLAVGTETAESVRFFASPVPVVAHIVGATVFCVLGALQFDPVLRVRRPRWHRVAGRIVAPSGLIAALSGVWMTVSYALPAVDGPALFAMRLLFGGAMAAFLVIGIRAVLRRDYRRHAAWMTRAYAIATAAGVQALIGVPWLILFGAPDESARAAHMGLGWLLPLAVAEYRIRRPSIARPPVTGRPAPTMSA